MSPIHFVNLTDGIEWIPSFGDTPFSFIRIESTAIEKSDWMGLLLNLDSNLLMNLALGNHCIVYDCGTRRPISKTISKGVPYIKSILTDLWINNVYFKAETELKQRVKRKLTYYKRFLNTNSIKLEGKSMETQNDGNKKYFKRVLHDHQIIQTFL